jgi:hypothetical protein
MLWDHKIPLCPSVPSSVPELVLTELGDQQVSVDPDYLQTTSEEESVAVLITITAGHHFWRSRLPR